MVVEEVTTIRVYKKDRDFLDRLKEKHRKNGMHGIVEGVLKVIKEHKLEEEIR